MRLQLFTYYLRVSSSGAPTFSLPVSLDFSLMRVLSGSSILTFTVSSSEARSGVATCYSLRALSLFPDVSRVVWDASARVELLTICVEHAMRSAKSGGPMW